MNFSPNVLQNNFLAAPALTNNIQNQMPPPKPLVDSKENVDQMTDKSRNGPSTQIHNALGSHHHQTQPNIPEDDGIDEESSIISELKTPTSSMP